jgi:HEPN domain-containing protein
MLNQSFYRELYESDQASPECVDNCQASQVIKEQLWKKECEKKFAFGWQLSQSFYAGAEFYRCANQKNLAVFMLHQSAEHALKTILRVHMRYVLEIHLIDYLLRSAALYSLQLRDVFKPSDPSDQKLLRILDNAYLDARYSYDFQVCDNELSILTERIKCIHIVLQDIWKQINKE